MDALAGPFLASALLLVAAGATKVVDPLPLVRALHSVGVRLRKRVVRVFAAGEVLLGAAAVVIGSRLLAAGVALSYAGFTAFVALARARGGVLASCGCFGKDDTPPTRTHIAVTAAAALVAAVVAVRPLGALPDLLDGQAAAGLPLLVVTAIVALLAYLVLARLPLLQARPAQVTR